MNKKALFLACVFVMSLLSSACTQKKRCAAYGYNPEKVEVKH